MLIHQSSLSETVDAVNEAVFFGHAMSAKNRRHAARWIAARQGLPGVYGELFAGFAPELASGIRLFTGERVTSASARHILGEESCRALLLLKSDDAIATAALTRATAWIVERVEKAATLSPRKYPRRVLLWQMHRRVVAEHPRRRARSARSTAATGTVEAWFDAGWPGRLARLSLLVHGPRADRNGSPRGARRVAVRLGAHPGSRRSGPPAQAGVPYAATRSPTPRSNDSDV